MDRRTFLGRTALLVGGLAVGGRLPLPETVESIAPAVVPSNLLIASGGICAPPAPYYDLAIRSFGDRPIREALPSFTAKRGGVRIG